MNLPTCREDALELDGLDEIAHLRDRFILPEGIIYLDGNSLGPLPAATPERLRRVISEEWGSDLIRGWEGRGWMELSGRVAGAIAARIGARPEEVAVADSTSLNLFKLLAAGLGLRPGRRVILAERESFPTDLYMAHGLAEMLGPEVSVRVVSRGELSEALTGEVAVLSLTHVDFRTGEMHDLEARTAEAHAAGAVMLWDLAHSAGAVPLALDESAVDLAVGCGYKYLNGGPGAPAFAFVASRHHAELRSPLWGWMGHTRPFDFSTAYAPAEGARRLMVGTPPILALAALECGVESLAGVSDEVLRAKSVALTELFIALVERDCAECGLGLASPVQPSRRGSQVSLSHPRAAAIVAELMARGVVADHRPPDLLRFGFAPAYVRFVDVWDAVGALRKVARGMRG